VATLFLAQWLARLRAFASGTTWHGRRGDAIEASKRRARKEGRLYDAYPDAPSGPVRMQLVVRGRGVWQVVDLDGYSLEDYVENIVYLERGPIRFANAVIRATNEANARLKLLEAERAEKARRATEERYERAVAQELAEKAKGHG
jgi:hypothetical protein